MIQTHNDFNHQNSEKTLQVYIEAIRHFRGYIDKERFNDDVKFLRQFVTNVSEKRELQKTA